MNLLVLGGSGFLSGAVVDAALTAGHAVTTVTRGRRPVRSGADARAADRDDAGELAAAVEGLRVDAVLDCCGYTLAGAEAAATVLGDVPRYVYVSSISAYRDWPPGPVVDESAPTFGPEADPSEYGPMKAASERVLETALADRLLSVRAGLIIGPGDTTRRLTSWLHRIATEDRVVVPAALDQPMTFVDSRDLAGWMVDEAQREDSGPVNAVGPVGMTTMGGLLTACRDAVAAEGGRPAELVPVIEDRLLEAGIEPWHDLPFWLPTDVASTAWQLGAERAAHLGLRTRPVEDSVRDAWRWVLEQGFEHPPRRSTEVEASLLAG